MKFKIRYITISVQVLFIFGFIAITTFGKNRPTPVDVEPLITEYLQIKADGSDEEKIRDWKADKSEAEMAAVIVVTSFGILNDVAEGDPTDIIQYQTREALIHIIENMIRRMDNGGDINSLYLTTQEAGMIPVRYVNAKAYETILAHQEADSLYIRTAYEVGRDFGTDSDEFVFWTTQCAESLLRKDMNYRYAIELLLPAMDAALNSPEVADSTACAYFISCARNYLQCGNHQEAKRLAHEAENRASADYKFIFKTGNILGEIYWIEGDRDKACSYFEKASHNAPSLSEFFSAGVRYSETLYRTGYYVEAEKVLLGLAKYLLPDELTADDFFHYYETLGVLYTFTDSKKSEENFKKADEFINWINYDDLIKHILNSQVYPNEGNSFKMISAIDRAEEAFCMLVNNKSRLLNEILFLKGCYLMNIHDYKNARKYLEAVYGQVMNYASGDPFLLQLLKRLAQLDEVEDNELRREFYLHQQLEEAKVHGKESIFYLDAVADALNFYLQVQDKDGSDYYLNIYRQSHPDDFETIFYEYRYLMLSGKVKEAEMVLREMLSMFPENKAIVELMLQRHYASQKSPKIMEVAETVFCEYKEKTIRQLFLMSAEERHHMDSELRNRRDELISAIAFAPELIETALNCSLFSKGLLFHTQNEISHLLASSDSAQMEIAKIKALKSELTKAINLGDKHYSFNIQEVINSRERYLVNDFLDLDCFRSKFADYSVDSLRNHIKDHDTLIDFVHYRNYNGIMCVGGFIVKKDKPVRFLDFGEFGEIQPQEFYGHIWNSILSQLSPEGEIYFSADGRLNFFPIEYVEDETGMPICEKYNLHRVFHLSDIRGDVRIGNHVELIGVADHNSPYGKASELNDGYRGNWSDLAGVETELYRIAEAIDGICECHRTFNDGATEKFVKSISGQPITTLHISTHGFFRSEEDLRNAFCDSTCFDHNVSKRILMGNRSSLSGLLMRNGNLSWKAEIINEDEDNILTSEEVETLSFPNLSLTVLSACETGLGEISADGVWGLQRAFRIAGASSLICSLYQVKDNGTADFMGEFYRQAACGLSVHEAFYNSRKELLNQDPAKKDVWSSFILIE